MHSLISALARYTGIRVILISPDELKLPGYLKTEVLEKNRMDYEETRSLDTAIPMLDVLYMTRIQRERFDDTAEYERLKDSYVLDPAKLSFAKKDLCVLHPLPRVNEISVAVDSDPRACYFKQALNGKCIRMALILKLLAEAKQEPAAPIVKELLFDRLVCKNPKCISQTEQELRSACKPSEGGVYRCLYCEAALTE